MPPVAKRGVPPVVKICAARLAGLKCDPATADSAWLDFRGLDEMKTFAASVAVWGVLGLVGLWFGAPGALLYWSGIVLVLFWIFFGTVWLFRQAPRRRPPRT